MPDERTNSASAEFVPERSIVEAFVRRKAEKVARVPPGDLRSKHGIMPPVGRTLYVKYGLGGRVDQCSGFQPLDGAIDPRRVVTRRVKPIEERAIDGGVA